MLRGEVDYCMGCSGTASYTTEMVPASLCVAERGSPGASSSGAVVCEEQTLNVGRQPR